MCSSDLPNRVRRLDAKCDGVSAGPIGALGGELYVARGGVRACRWIFHKQHGLVRECGITTDMQLDVAAGCADADQSIVVGVDDYGPHVFRGISSRCASGKLRVPTGTSCAEGRCQSEPSQIVHEEYFELRY